MTLQASASLIDLDALLAAARGVGSHLSALGELEARALGPQERSGHELDGGIALSVTSVGTNPSRVGLLAGIDAAAVMAGAGDVLETWEPVMSSLVADLSEGVDDLEPLDLQILAPAGNGPALDPEAVSIGLFRDSQLMVAIGFVAELGEGAAQAAGEEHQAEAGRPFPQLVDDDTAAGEVRRMRLLRDVEMGVTVELGRTRMTVRDLLALSPGTIVELDRAAGSPVDVLVNGTLMARGEVVVIDEEFAVRISEIVTPEQDSRFGA